MSGLAREFELILYQHGRTKLGLDENLKKVVKKLGEARVETNAIAVLPEMWFGPIAIEEDRLDAALTPLHLLSTDLGIHIVPGAFYVKTERGTFSRSYLISPGDRRELISEKIFPSHPMKEREKIKRGRTLRVLDLGFARISSIICVDAIYPEIPRYLSINGAEIILNPASIPANRAQLWRSLASVRAAENTVFWATVMLTESTYPDGRPLKGGSVVAGPRGEIIADMGALEQAIKVKISPDLIEKQRSRWPYLRDIEEIGWKSKYEAMLLNEMIDETEQKA
ncbi:MAG: carbon-nitrogen hydrolase family protein [Fervidicoccaceae archaeon]